MQIPALTPRTTSRRIATVTAVFGAILAALPQVASAGAVFPDSAQSPIAEKVNLLYLVIFVVGIIAIIGVIASVVRATRTDGPQEPTTSSATPALVGGSVVAVVLAILGGWVLSSTSGARPSNSGVGSEPRFKATPYQDPSLKVAHNVRPPKGPAISVHVNGQQFLWRYDYPGFKDIYSYSTLVVPVGVTTLLDVTSSDVEHGWWVPQLGGSISAMPGYINRSWIRADKAGTYEGSGTVLNGTNYASMTTRVIAMPPAEFLAWTAAKKIEIDKAVAALLRERQSGEQQALISGQNADTAASQAKSQAPEVTK